MRRATSAPEPVRGGTSSSVSAGPDGVLRTPDRDARHRRGLRGRRRRADAGACPGSAAANAARAAVLLPLALADAEGRPRPPRSKPMSIGTGALCAEMATPRDEELFARLLDTIDPSQRADPEHVSALAQSWRLPVLPVSLTRRRGRRARERSCPSRDRARVPDRRGARGANRSFGSRTPRVLSRA